MPGVKNCAAELARWEEKYQSVIPDCHTHLIRTLIIWCLKQSDFLPDLKNNSLFIQNKQYFDAANNISEADSFNQFYAMLYCDQTSQLKKKTWFPELDPNLHRILGSIFAWFPLKIEEFPNFITSHQVRKGIVNRGENPFNDLFTILKGYLFDLDETKDQNYYITPAIFAQFVENKLDQRALGVYFTGRDITEYITQKAVIGSILVQLQKKHMLDYYLPKITNRILAHPENYLYPVYFHGYGKEYPSQITESIENPLYREKWQLITPQDWGSVGEIWRETIERHNQIRFWLTRLKNASDPVPLLIGANMDLAKILMELIAEFETGIELLIVAQFIKSLRILDPTCGVGDFILASARILYLILYRIYECLQLKDAALIPQFIGEHFFYHKPFLSKDDAREAAICSALIESCFYGVDLHPPAIANAKLRLFLLYCNQIRTFSSISRELKMKYLLGLNYNHFDLHIRCGNSLIGSWIPKKLPEYAWKYPLADAILRSDIINNLNQTELPNLQNSGIFNPLHWTIEFYPELQTGGFDIILGNPPYLEATEINYPIPPQYSENNEQRTGQPIHALCIERAIKLLLPEGALGMIVPMALVSTQRMKYLQNLIEENRSVWYANFAWRPGKLFDAVNRSLTIFWVLPTKNPQTYSTGYIRWYANRKINTRSTLFQQISFQPVPRARDYFFVPKFATPLDSVLFDRMGAIWLEFKLGTLLEKKNLSKKAFFPLENTKNDQIIYYRSTGGLYWKIFTAELPAFEQNGNKTQSSRTQLIYLKEKTQRDTVIAILNSDFFWWWYSITSNLRDVNPWDIENFPITLEMASDLPLAILGQKLMQDLNKHSVIRTRKQSLTGKGENQTQHFLMKKSKSLLNQIDARMAELYGFSLDILDYIQNYDIKFRMDLLR